MAPEQECELQLQAQSEPESQEKESKVGRESALAALDHDLRGLRYERAKARQSGSPGSQRCLLGLERLYSGESACIARS